jgi:beta-phosphoglucomutase-like phosphatase (HAD superfamily)
MNNIKACIFDLDGVIVDTAVYHYKAWKRLANSLGLRFYRTPERATERRKPCTLAATYIRLGRRYQNRSRAGGFGHPKKYLVHGNG